MSRRQLARSALSAAMLMLPATTLLAAPPEIVAVRQTLPQKIYDQFRQQLIPESALDQTVAVKRYEKLELRVDLKATFDNPYDPDQVDLWAEFRAPSGKTWKIWGFYNPSTWAQLWMVRFTPVETGVWQVVVKVRDREGTAEGPLREIPVIAGDHRGFVHIAPNHRYFRYDDGTPFYGVGLWYNDGYEQFDRGLITEAGLDELAAQGANFISFFHTPLETMGTGLGRYDENRAGRLDQIFEWCEQRDIQVSWNLWFHSYISEAIWGGGNARYRNNPYRAITNAEQFFTSEEAFDHATRLHRYMIARWGYSRALFLWFVIDEINGTEGWLTGGHDAAEQWCRRVHAWFKANDPYGRATTGTRSGGVEQWWPGGYATFDVAAREIYELQGHPGPKGAKANPVSDNPLRYSYLTYAKQAQDLWNGFNKPTIVGEAGWDHTFHEPAMPGYQEMYHNALWTGLANGLSTTPFWWSYGPYVNGSIVLPSMRPLTTFLQGIDFAAATWTPTPTTVTHGDGWAMQSPAMTFGWAVNPVDGVAAETVTIGGFADGDYDVYLFRTWRGLYLDPQAATASGGSLSFTIPELRPRGGRAQTLGNDVAFKIVRKGGPVVLQ